MMQPRYCSHALSKARVKCKMPAAEQHMILSLYSDPVLMSEPCRIKLEHHVSRGDGYQAIRHCTPANHCALV